MRQPFTVLDLFCGAGGLSCGFINASYRVLAAIDNYDAAVQTYAANLGSHVLKWNISDDSDFPETTIIIGGPPCQGFSSAGLRRSNDHRNSLVARFAQLVAKLRPKAFVFENVEGFLTAEAGTRVFELLTPLISAGYRIHLRKVNAANYGVPQHRKRVIAIGGLGWDPHFPEPTHSAFGAPGALSAAPFLPLTPTVMDAIGSLPPAQPEPPGVPQGHYYRRLNGLELARAAALKPGQTMRDLPAELQHDSYQRRASRRVMDGTPTERRGGAPAGIRRLLPNQPSKAITGGALAEFVHPAENRSLTIRECARLQTFSDDFVFCGNKAEQTQLVGNAVPPLLAQVIAQSLAHDLENIESMVDKGALLSFVPTLSEGFSPVLKMVTELVQERFKINEESHQLRLWD
jgi:DNA (cytosine-5)-methyltransferase 1